MTATARSVATREQRLTVVKRYAKTTERCSPRLADMASAVKGHVTIRATDITTYLSTDFLGGKTPMLCSIIVNGVYGRCKKKGDGSVSDAEVTVQGRVTAYKDRE